MSRAQKEFDAVQMTRAIRDRISAEIEGMTVEEEMAWLASRELNDPYLKELRQKARQASAGDTPRRR